MKPRAVLTPQARAELRKVLAYIDDGSSDAAERVNSEFWDLIRKIARSPEMGHFHDELADRKYRFFNFYSYAVVYEWERRPVRVITIVHGSRNLGALLRSPDLKKRLH